MNRKGITKRWHSRASVAMAAVAMLLSSLPTLQAQRITNFNVPTDVCAGETKLLTFGFNDTNNAVIQTHHATLGQSVLTFLPDGVPCNGACSYQSPVTFSDFAPDATITSVQDIKYVRLKIEHSWIGDIYIALHCPNGNKVSLMNYGGSGTS